MHRCFYCGHLIWPWQHRGHYVREDRSLLRWHASHLYAAVPNWREHPEELVAFIVKDGVRRAGR
jgi:hypothetical protein